MAGLLQVHIVASDEEVWTGEAATVIVRTTEGDVGILPGHAPFMAAIQPCAAEVITSEGVRKIIAVDTGFISVFLDRVSLLAASGDLADEISLDSARSELAHMHDVVDRAEVTSADLRQYNRVLSQVKAGERYEEMARALR